MAEPRTSYAPRYVQIADELKARLGVMEPGTRLSSEPQLAREFAVSRFTIARAIEQLADEGLVTRRQGSGTFVAEAPLRRSPGYLLSFTEAVRESGHLPTHRLLAYRPAGWEHGLPYDRAEPLILMDRLRLVDGVAVARHRSLLSRRLVERIALTQERVGDPSFSLYSHFEEYGLSVDSAVESLVAYPAEPENRKLLGLPRNGAVIAVNRHSFAADGTVLDCVSAIYDARRYSYEARLVRRHRLGNTSTSQENDNEPQTDARDRHAGPRLGPWPLVRDGG